MAPRSGQFGYVDFQDHILFGFVEGLGAGDEAQVSQKRDLRTPLELTHKFFHYPESHAIPLPLPVTVNTPVSHPAPVSAFRNSFSCEGTDFIAPSRPSYNAGNHASNINHTHQSIDWDRYKQLVYMGLCTEQSSSSVFGRYDGDTSTTEALVSMPVEEYRPTFLSPIHVPPDWMLPDSLEWSCPESNTSFETALKESSDRVVDRCVPLNKDIVLLHPSSYIPIYPQQHQLPRSNLSLGFVPMSMDDAAERTTAETGLVKKTTKGRKGPLNLQAKKEAAEMRNKRACDSCRRRKIKCDKGAPCGACIQYYKCDLVHFPCRGMQLQHLAGVLLRGNVFPKARSLIDYTSNFRIDAENFEIELRFGFGIPLVRQVKLVQLTNYSHCITSLDSERDLEHDHIVYPWPIRAGQTTQKEVRRHRVFPAVLSKTTDLSSVVESHITALLDNRFTFAQFPLFNSPLKILKTIYMHYESLSESSEKQLLRQALKLLVLVHIGGDTTINPTASSWAIITQFFGSTIDSDEVTPCFIRGQLGPVFSELAFGLMKEVLTGLEFHFVSQKCAHFPLIISTFAVVFMAVESIQYHAAKDSYHATYDGNSSKSIIINKPGFEPDSEGVDALLTFYKAHFSGYHFDSLLSVSKSVAPVEGAAGGRCVALLKEAVGQVKNYLMARSVATFSPGEEDMTLFFDRLLARLFLLRS